MRKTQRQTQVTKQQRQKLKPILGITKGENNGSAR